MKNSSNFLIVKLPLFIHYIFLVLGVGTHGLSFRFGTTNVMLLKNTALNKNPQFFIYLRVCHLTMKWEASTEQTAHWFSTVRVVGIISHWLRVLRLLSCSLVTDASKLGDFIFYTRINVNDKVINGSVEISYK